jgi:hypothetical protein
MWAGSPTYRHDRQRSCALQDFAAVLQTPGIAFYFLSICSASHCAEAAPSRHTQEA